MIVADDLHIEIAPGADLSADPSTWPWVDISTEVRHADGVDISGVGRGNESASADTPSLTIRVENDDGDFSSRNPLGQWFPDLGVGTPIRVYWDTDANVRFAGHISELPPRWTGDESGSDEVAIIRADGFTRRRSQGEQPLNSAIFRSVSTHPNVIAYWPCEDNEGSTSAASPLAGVAPLQLGETVTFGQQADGLPGSASSVLLGTGTGPVLGRVPNHTPGDVYVVQLAWRQDEVADGNRAILEANTTSPDLARWRVFVDATNFNLEAFDADGVKIVDASEAWHPDLFDRWVRAELRLENPSTILSWSARLYAIDTDATVLNELSDSIAGSDIMGRIVRAGVGGGGFPQERFTAHISVFTGTETKLGFDPDQTAALLHPPFHGWSGELAADRFERLCDEEGLSCSIIAPTGGLRPFAGATTDNASTPDQASLRITGDIDLRGWLTAQDWSNSTFRELIHRWDTSVDQRSYMLEAGNNGRVALLWSTDGTSAGTSFIQSTAQIPIGSGRGRIAVRGILDVDNGASGHDVALYFGPSLDGPWTLLHSETIAGTTSIHAGTADLLSGGKSGSIVEIANDVVHSARVYDGIDGTLVADPDFEAQDIGTTSFQDTQGNTWTVNGDAAIVRADDSMPMGPQGVETLTTLLEEIETADAGMLSEADFGFVYRTRTTLYNQAAALTLSQPDGELAQPPEPTDDDQQVRNDVTVERQGGSDSRAVDDDHIDAHGRYEESVTASVETDDQALQLAHWRLHLGTVDEYRWPRIDIALHADPQLIATWLATKIGDRIDVDHDIAQLVGVDIDLILAGWEERFDQFRWDVTLNCVPASPFTVAVFDTDRFDTAGSETSGSFVAGTDTSLTVVTTATRPWVNSTDHAAEFPFHIEVSGVVLNVTAISGASSPQTLTVDATPVNGIEKTIASGSAVQLAARPVFAL